jgi:VacB/RNase II family 3'-5' exoribonuclease
MSQQAPPPRAADLRAAARQAMRDHGLDPDFPAAALRELAAIRGPAVADDPAIRDQRDLLWSSIDNDDSRDLDQLTLAEPLPGGATRVLVAIADVDALVHPGSALDAHAAQNTTSVYTPAGVFPMLPERLSTDLTSLGPGDDRLAVVFELDVAPDGTAADRGVYRAVVRNQAKLAYGSVAAWLEGDAAPPPLIQQVPGLADQLRLQDAAAERLRRRRHERGALQLELVEARVVVRDGVIAGLEQEPKNRARELIEDFMIAANGLSARYLIDRGVPTLRRVVRSPERWDRIERLAADLGERLPADPDPLALEAFLERRRAADRERYPDLSLAVVKLLGSGEYVVETPDETHDGHFGLAVREYTHSTAPNRRFPDLLVQRLLKAALAGRPPPYSAAALADIAHHCTVQEDQAHKVERQVRKSAAALLLAGRIGERFDALVTGASPKGTWVRVLRPPVEGKLVAGGEGVDVGDRLRVELLRVDVGAGFIDFRRVAE